MVEKPKKTQSQSISSGFVDDYFAYLLARASFLVSSEFHAQLAAAGIDVPTWRVLATLVGSNGRPVGELADMVLLKQPTLSKALDRMIAEGLAKRAASRVDRRQVKVNITPKGQALVAGLLRQAREHEDMVMSSYSSDEREALKHMLKTLIGRLSQTSEQ